MAVWDLIWNDDKSRHPAECYKCQHFSILVLCHLFEDINEVCCENPTCPSYPENIQPSPSGQCLCQPWDPTPTLAGPM